MARPSKFSEALTAKMIQLYKKGKTDAQVAEIIGVSERTINNWKVTHPEFMQSLKESKGIADDLVEASLFSRAVGYTFVEEKIFCSFGKVTKVKTNKHVPPDVIAAIFWLKNRQPDRWRETPAADVNENHSQLADKQPVTFKEFCNRSGYFLPFLKQEEMRAFGMDIDEVRLLLGARGYGKTDFVTIMGVAYDLYVAYTLGKDMSEHTNLIITKSKSRNSAIMAEIKEALEKNGVQMEKANASVIRVAGLIGQDHSVEAITIKTSMRGRHPKRIVMDDPVTDEDVSEAMRATVKRRYDEAYKLCKNIIIIGQPAHYDDLYAHLRNKIRTMEVPHGSIVELDADLDSMLLAGVDPESIEMSYKLKIPKSGGAIFANLKFIDKYPAGDSVAYIDPSDGGDYTALSIIKGYFSGVAVLGKTYKRAWYHCIDDIVPVLVANGVRRVCFETNKHGEQPIEQLQKLLAEHKIGVVGRHSKSNKQSAISQAGSYAHMIHLSKESDKNYTDQVTKYEYKSKYDDAPDSLARGLEWLGLIKGKE